MLAVTVHLPYSCAFVEGADGVFDTISIIPMPAVPRKDEVVTFQERFVEGDSGKKLHNLFFVVEEVIYNSTISNTAERGQEIHVLLRPATEEEVAHIEDLYP